MTTELCGANERDAIWKWRPPSELNTDKRTIVTEGNGMDIEDDVWVAAVTIFGLVNDEHVWGFVQTEPILEDVWANVGAKMTLVDEPLVWVM
ncbi:hypothetical protein V6N13_068553 [Hibiscus sabdariffa]